MFTKMKKRHSGQRKNYMQRCWGEKKQPAYSAGMKQESFALIKVILQYTNVLNWLSWLLVVGIKRNGLLGCISEVKLTRHDDWLNWGVGSGGVVVVRGRGELRLTLRFLVWVLGWTVVLWKTSFGGGERWLPFWTWWVWEAFEIATRCLVVGS